MRAISLTSFIHIKPNEKTVLEDILKEVGNPIKRDNPYLQFGPSTHFARLVILPGSEEDIIYPGQHPDEEEDKPERYRYRLMVNAVFDGTTRSFVQELIAHSPDLDSIFTHCEGYAGTDKLHDFLTNARHLRDSQIFYDTFIGENVQSIQEKARQRITFQNILDQNDLDDALDIMLELDPVPEPPPVDSTTPAQRDLIMAAVVVIGATLIALALLWAIAPVLAVIAIVLLGILLAAVLVPAIQVLGNKSGIGLFGAIKDQVDEHDEKLARAREYFPVDMKSGREDVLVQNQFNLYLTFKGGWLESKIRLLRMIILMFVLGRLTDMHPSPGSLGGLTTVHFGHWVLIDGGRRLFFITNYDGAWETYIADFVNKIYPLLDVQLHNFVGFSSDGTRDISSFRRWLRRVQIQSGVFYSAYPFLTVRNIQRDRAINAKFPKDRHDTKAVHEWLALFGSPPHNQPFAEDKNKLAPRNEKSQLTKAEWPDIQSFIVYGYANFSQGRYLFLHITDGEKARAWLRSVLPMITTVDAWDANEITKELNIAVNIAFTHAGLALLGLGEDTLETFSTEFREGIAPAGKGQSSNQDVLHPRSVVLGDTGESSPFNWRIGNPVHRGTDSEFHVVLILSGRTKEAISNLLTTSPFSQIGDGTAGVIIAHDEGGATPHTGREPFGFRDGISNPWVEGTRYNLRKRDGSKGRPLQLDDKEIIKEQEVGQPNRVISLIHDPVVRTGEFILGYCNEYGQLPQTPLVWGDSGDILKPVQGDGAPDSLHGVRDFGRNGSYLVYRKLQQDVQGFWNYLAEINTAEDMSEPDTHEVLKTAAKMVGRWPSGVPLALSPDADDLALKQKASELKNHSILNDFAYRPHDEAGLTCPFGSHLRRGNPRDSMVDDSPSESVRNSNLHRVMRRAVTFGKLCDHQIDPDYFQTHGAPKEVTHDLADAYPEDPDGVGIHFFGINSDIQRQFEFVQQAWNNNGKFNGMFSNKDPITGDNPEHLPEEERVEAYTRYAERDVDLLRLQPSDMTIPEEPVRRRLDNMPRFVHVRGGAYLFIPSITAMRYLVENGVES